MVTGMKKDVIVNGTLDVAPNQIGFGWSGNDIEINAFRVYNDGSSTNRVAELDGRAGQITVLRQTVQITNAQTATLTFDSAIRNNPKALAGTDGFRVDIKDASGTVIATKVILPTTKTLIANSLIVTFPAAGNYTIMFTEIGNNDSFGALLDNISLMVCLTKGTLIRTPRGAVPIETLRVGDSVSTLDGDRPLRWIGTRHLVKADLDDNIKLRPVRIKAGALGALLPTADLCVSRQHRMVVASAVARRMFDTPMVLASAIRLTDLPGIAIDMAVETVTYIHLAFDDHAIIFANDAPTESLLLTPTSIQALTPAARAELTLLFPQKVAATVAPKSALTIPAGAAQRKLIEEHGSRRKPVICKKFWIS